MTTRLLPRKVTLVALAFWPLAFPPLSLAAPASASPPDEIEGKAYRLERAYFCHSSHQRPTKIGITLA